MDYQHALEYANEIIGTLSPYCTRVGIAGSVRRKKKIDIKDIEVVAIPRTTNLYELAAIVNSKWGIPSAGAFPSRYTKVRGAYAIDFFWTDPKRWGMIYFIRTGPAEFVQHALAHWKRITKGGYSEEGILHTPDGKPVETPEEKDVFIQLRTNFIPPEQRYKFPSSC